MKIKLNGREKEIEKNCSLEDIVGRFSPHSKLVIAEHNGVIIKSPLWPQTKIQDRDAIELVTFVGGG